jgi:cobalt-zinc-cadmium efflux system membrane fusion protein
MQTKYIVQLLIAAALMGGNALSSCKGKTAEEESEAPAPSEHNEAGHKEEEGAHEGEDPNRVELSADQLKMAEISLGRISSRAIGSGLQVNGIIDAPPENVVSVNAPLGGFVKQTELLQGSKVRKGQVLATIQNPDFLQLQQEYLEGRSQLELARSEYERQKELVAEDVTPVKTFQKAKAEYQMVQARMSALSQRLKLANIPLAKLNAGKIVSEAPIFSPINGYVRAVNINLGSFVNPADVLFELINPEHLHVELTVFEKDAMKLKKGQKVRFTLPDEPTKERTATIHLIGQAIGSERSIRVHAHQDNEDATLLPGMYVKATIEIDKRTTPAVPDESLVEFEGKNYLFTFQGKEEAENTTVYQMVEVGKGVSQDGYSAVILPEKFDTTAQIVTKGAFSLLSKLKNSEEEGGGHGH